MREFLPPSTLWAMHPIVLRDYLAQSLVEAIIPDALRSMVSATGGGIRPMQSHMMRVGTAAIVPIHGVLAPQGMIPGGTAYEAIADQVRGAAADASVQAIILDIRSPGGTVWGCQEAGDAIYAARAVKPIIAVASPYCFSAAYWLATQGGRVFATPSGHVGSVGVRSGHTDTSGFEEKMGMKTTLIASSRDKIAAHPHAPLSAEDCAEIQAGVDESNRMFTRAIARGRGMKPGDVAAIHGTGKTFSAPRAHAMGAIDGVLALRDVIARYSTPDGSRTLSQRREAVRKLAQRI